MDTTKIYVVYQITWTLWLHRNSHVYQNHPLGFAPRINAILAKAHLEVATQYTTSHKKMQWMIQAVSFIVPHSSKQMMKTQARSITKVVDNE